MNRLSLLFLTAAAALPAVPAFAQSDVGRTRAVLDQWVETRQILSKEKADWQLEQSILEDTRNLLGNRLERLEEQLKELEESATVADEERSGLTAERDQLNAAAEVIEAEIAVLETRLKAILKTLPDPLMDKIRPLVRRIPEDPADTKLSLGERVQNIVGILSQADKFNNTVTFTAETRQVDNGKEVEVRTLYWGVALAFYADATGEYAGIGHPGEESWEWPRIEGAGADIVRLLDVYEGVADIQFVEVPARIE
jgi:hypothetical protein